MKFVFSSVSNYMNLNTDCETLISHTNSMTQYASCPPPPTHFDRPDLLHSMLCSTSTANSSGWLRRLRSSKGFPDSDHPDLEHFLANSLHKIDPQTTHPHQRLQLDGNLPTPIPDDIGNTPKRDVISNVLSELFHMGECKDLSRIARKKSCRKQPCPRVCVVSSNSDVEDVLVPRENVSLPLPLDLSSKREAGEELKERREDERGEENVGKERRHVDLSDYSQTEVTVIDTSVPFWKFEKTLFRKKNVWKVGDKKGKGKEAMSCDTKKKKKKKNACLNENSDGNKKKLKACSSSSKYIVGEDGPQKKKKLKKLCSPSKHADKEKTLVISKPIQGHEVARRSIIGGRVKKQDNCSSVDGGSSVILIKSIPTTNRKSCGKSRAWA